MLDLRLVGVHDDGEHLVLSNSEGQRFRLRVDDSLRAAVRRDRPHLGQLQIEKAGGLRPKDIQARIRAGATAEQIAAATDWPVERIRRYEGPVLAERSHIAQVAQSVRLRRRPAEQVTLGSEVAARLTARGVDLDGAEWDAWRTDSGPWTVAVSFVAGGKRRQACWQFDLSARSVVSGDDEARWLSEQIAQGDGPLAAAHLAAVPQFDPDQPVFVESQDSPGTAQVRNSQEAAARAADPVDLAALRTRRAGAARGRSTAPEPTDVPGAPPRPNPAARTADPQNWPTPEPPAAHPPASQVSAPPSQAPAAPSSEPEPAVPTPAARKQAAARASQSTAAAAASRTAAATPARAATRAPAAVAPPAVAESAQLPAARATTDASAESTAETKAVAAKHRTTRNKRASVPSWDDIMFGTKRD